MRYLLVFLAAYACNSIMTLGSSAEQLTQHPKRPVNVPELFGVWIGMDVAQAGPAIESRFAKLENAREPQSHILRPAREPIYNWNLVDERDVGFNISISVEADKQLMNNFYAQSVITTVEHPENGRPAVSRLGVRFEYADLEYMIQEATNQFGNATSIQNTGLCVRTLYWQKATTRITLCRASETAMGAVELLMEDKDFELRAANAKQMRRGGAARPKL